MYKNPLNSGVILTVDSEELENVKYSAATNEMKTKVNYKEIGNKICLRCIAEELYFLNFFLQDMGHFCGVTDRPVLV